MGVADDGLCLHHVTYPRVRPREPGAHTASTHAHQMPEPTEPFVFCMPAGRILICGANRHTREGASCQPRAAELSALSLPAARPRASLPSVPLEETGGERLEADRRSAARRAARQPHASHPSMAQTPPGWFAARSTSPPVCVSGVSERARQLTIKQERECAANTHERVERAGTGPRSKNGRNGMTRGWSGSSNASNVHVSRIALPERITRTSSHFQRPPRRCAKRTGSHIVLRTPCSVAQPGSG